MRFVRCVSTVNRASPLFLQHPLPTSVEIMKKTKQHGNKRKTVKIEDKNTETTAKPAAKVDSLDDDEQGFGGWLRSPDGLETMKLFVIANSIVMLTTLVYPHVQTVFQIVAEMIYGPDTVY